MAKRAQLARVITTSGVDISSHIAEVNVQLRAGQTLPLITLSVYGRLDTDAETGQITVTVEDAAAGH